MWWVHAGERAGGGAEARVGVAARAATAACAEAAVRVAEMLVIAHHP